VSFKIAIPSMNRPKDVRKTALFEVGHIVVPESQLEEYKSVSGISPVAWVPVPDEIDSLSKTRQWIVDELWGKKEDFIFQADDDLIALVYMFSRSVRYNHNPDYIRAVIGHVGQCAVDAGAGLFGFATQPKPQERSTNNPFMLRKWISAQGLGITDRSLKFDPNLRLKEDLDIALANLQKNRIVWCDERWCMYSEHWSNRGGLQVVRTYDREEEAFDYIVDKWGSGVVHRDQLKAGEENKQKRGTWSIRITAS
jgi:hypothetical protein